MGRTDETVKPMGYIARRRKGGNMDSRVIQTSLLKLKGGDPNMLNGVLIRSTLLKTLKSKAEDKVENADEGIERKPLTPVRPWIKEMNLKAQNMKSENEPSLYKCTSVPDLKMLDPKGSCVFEKAHRRVPSLKNEMKEFSKSMESLSISETDGEDIDDEN